MADGTAEKVANAVVDAAPATFYLCTCMTQKLAHIYIFVH